MSEAAEKMEEKETGLRVIEGGKAKTAPADPNLRNWLGELDKGTIFLYRRRISNPNYHLDIFQVAHQWGDATLLGRHYEDQPDYIEYVDSKLFSSQHELFKILMVLPQKQEEEEENDDTGNRSD
jgi:hypothetical protein